MRPYAHHAAGNGDLAMVLQLLQGGADVNANSQLGTHFTCFTATKVQTLQLLQGGADVKANSQLGTHVTRVAATRVQTLTRRKLCGAPLICGRPFLRLLAFTGTKSTNAD